MLKFYMMIGVPGAGKSTWISSEIPNDGSFVVISSDAIIDQRAAEQGKTYSEIFQAEIKSATAEMNLQLTSAIANRKNIVWDQTNLTTKVRKAKLSQIPDHFYTKVAVFFKTPDDATLKQRLANRPGKIIPSNIIMGMKSTLQLPTLFEGFDEIISIG